MADRHYGLTRGQNQSWQATAMSPLPDVDVRINFDNGITRHEAVAALDVIKNAVLEDKWPPVDPATPSSGAAIEDRNAWLREREKVMAPILANLNANCIVYNTANGVAGLQAACDDARTQNKPLKLVGSTPLDLSSLGTAWTPKAHGASGRLIMFSDGEVTIKGNTRIILSSDVHLYNLRSEAANSLTAFYANDAGTQQRITIMGCTINPWDRGRAFYATGGSSVQRMLFRYNEIGPCQYTVYGFSPILSEFSDNRSYKDNINDRHFFRTGGYRNRWLRNYMQSGRVGITALFNHASDATRLYPYQQSFIDDLIEGNFFDQVAEEAVSYDMDASSATNHAGLTITTIQAISGTATSSPTLQCSYDGVSDITKWTPTPFRFAFFLSGPCAGHFAQLWSLAVADADTVNMVIRGKDMGVPVLKPRNSTTGGTNGRRVDDLYLGELAQEDFTAALVGSVVMVCDLAIGTRILNNTFVCRDYYPGKGALVLGGNSVGFEVSGNRFIDLAPGSDYHGIKCTTISGINAKPSGAGNPNWGATQIAGQNQVQFPVSHGRVYNNDMGGMLLTLNNDGYSGANVFLPGPYKIEVFNNFNCRGGGPAVGNWRGNGGVEYSPATPVYDTSSTWIYNNS